MEHSNQGRLPRGRHNLSREEVAEAQRLRLIAGVAEAVRTTGYTNTSVASIIKNAGVSRETFYRLYDSKLDCYLDAFDFMSLMLLDHLRDVANPDSPAMEQLEAVIRAYLESIASEPGFARLFLVESFAAGPSAIERRDRIQMQFAESMAEILLLPQDDHQGRFACRLFVAGVSTMVTRPLINDDSSTITALADQLIDEIRVRFPLAASSRV